MNVIHMERQRPFWKRQRLLKPVQYTVTITVAMWEEFQKFLYRHPAAQAFITAFSWGFAWGVGYLMALVVFFALFL